jgi:hypothetical protein
LLVAAADAASSSPSMPNITLHVLYLSKL